MWGVFRQFDFFSGFYHLFFTILNTGQTMENRTEWVNHPNPSEIYEHFFRLVESDIKELENIEVTLDIMHIDLTYNNGTL